MKKISVILVIFISILLLSSCATEKTSYNTVYNYMQTSYLFSCGDYFVTIKDKVPFVFRESEDDGYFIVDNAIDLTEAGLGRVINADDVSFYYTTLNHARTYGSGNGYRIYRYFVESGKNELVFSEVSITNFDSALGLEDVFNISAPISSSGFNFTSVFYFDGETIIPDFEMKNTILEEIEKQALDIELYQVGLRFAVTDNKVLFTDVLGKLWRYDPKTHVIEKFCNENTVHFFVTEKNVFIIPNVTGKIAVFDLQGNKLKEFDTGNSDFPMFAVQLSGKDCYLIDSFRNIWQIDGNLNMSKTGFKPESGYWCVKGNQILLYEDDYNLYDIE